MKDTPYLFPCLSRVAQKTEALVSPERQGLSFWQRQALWVAGRVVQWEPLPEKLGAPRLMTERRIQPKSLCVFIWRQIRRVSFLVNILLGIREGRASLYQRENLGRVGVLLLGMK